MFYLGGWKARGIPKGGFGRVLARKEKKGEKFWSAVSTGLIHRYRTYGWGIQCTKCMNNHGQPREAKNMKNMGQTT
jgi:hypothetical protein